MADRRAQYHTNGAAAYDVYAWNQSTAPQRRPEPQHLPEERPLPQKRQRAKARTALAPFTVVGMLAVACLLVLVVFGYVQLFEATSEVSKLENQLSALQSQQTQLQSRYEARIDLDAIWAIWGLQSRRRSRSCTSTSPAPTGPRSIRRKKPASSRRSSPRWSRAFPA